MLFIQTISFTRSAVTKDSLGGEIRGNYQAVGDLTGVPASIQPEVGGLVDVFMRRGIKISHSVYSRADLSAVQIGDRGTDQDGRVYIVRFSQDMAGRGKMWCVMVDLLI